MQILHPAGHGVVVALDDTRVAIRTVDRPRHDNASVTPGRSAPPQVDEFRTSQQGRHIGKGTFGGLGVLDVDHPFLEEGGDVHVERGGADEDLSVPHPTEALVALRAVGRHAQEVAALAPDDVLLELVDQRAGALEGPARRRGGVDYAARDRTGLRLTRIARNLDVAEAVERETRLVDLLALAP